MEMFDKLEDIVNRYEDITAELSNPDVVNDQDRFRKLMKEQNNILPIVTAFTEYKDCKKNIEDSLAMLSEESDEELLELAKEELNESKKRVEELENELIKKGFFIEYSEENRGFAPFENEDPLVIRIIARK